MVRMTRNFLYKIILIYSKLYSANEVFFLDGGGVIGFTIGFRPKAIYTLNVIQRSFTRGDHDQR